MWAGCGRGMSRRRSNGEIGRELFLSEDTVKTHARRLFLRIDAGWPWRHALAAAFARLQALPLPAT